ncbi:hypothetical protein [Azohydromonas lata]|uniref:DUF4124 domain-containing protein n=1 Tax=Azohydromonas lata TaxID=45677 RepID=A0ABU5I8N5_9BURK|nr:hypothetical protein [Azohydromonas lata]MDZ5455459.1 hypothetical protein [Azohydromonas lata]
MKRVLLPALLLAAATAASAQAVYRCGPDGSDYRQTPCPGGQALNVADPRTDAQRSEAAQRAQRDAELAQGLRQPAPAGGAAASPARSARPAAPPTAEHKTADHKSASSRHHGKRHHTAAENARTARAPVELKPAKTSKAKPADAQP